MSLPSALPKVPPVQYGAGWNLGLQISPAHPQVLDLLISTSMGSSAHKVPPGLGVEGVWCAAWHCLLGITTWELCPPPQERGAVRQIRVHCVLSTDYGPQTWSHIHVHVHVHTHSLEPSSTITQVISGSSDFCSHFPGDKTKAKSKWLNRSFQTQSGCF